ncbi:MAG TPA: hypothetical protein DD727_03680 [Clostridiales bacterium]|nr:hypothetical protein [Clostridiales bacterium]
MIWKSTTAFYNEIVRVPLIMRYPSQIKAQALSMPAETVDLMPTILETAGLPVPGHIHGKSLLPYMIGDLPEDNASPYAYCMRASANAAHVRQPAGTRVTGRMIRSREWKYVQYADGEEFLYHLIDDPGETRNRADSPEGNEIKETLRQVLDRWISKTKNDRLGVTE